MADKKDFKYEDLTQEEKYKSAIEADKAPWNPLQTAKELIVEKLTTKKPEPKPVAKKRGGCMKMAKGGSASARADGCAVKGKTKGKLV